MSDIPAVNHLTGVGILWLGSIYMATADYHLVVHRDLNNAVSTITGTVMAETAAGPGYTLELEDGRTLACTLVTRVSLSWFFTVETTELLHEPV